MTTKLSHVAIDPARLKSRLIELVKIPSFTGHEREAIERVAAWLAETGADVDHWVDSMRALEGDDAYPGREVEREAVPVVAARLDGGLPGPSIMLTGHVDVVPIGERAQWQRDPFGAELEGDRLYGRGACDMKSGVVAALEVFTALAQSGARFPGSLIFVAVPGEEDGGTGTLSAIRRDWRADAIIITEPTAREGVPPEVIVAHGGALTFTITVEGRSTHACKRLEGESALTHYITLHDAMRRGEAQLNDGEQDPLLRTLGLPYPTCVGRVAGGVWSSSVMDRLEAEVRVGVAVGESVEEAEARFRGDLMRAAAADPWLRDHPPTIERTGAAFSSSKIDPEHHLVEVIRDAAEKTSGRRPALAAAPYGCDMAMWTRVGGCPTLVYGPGDVRLAHAPDEWVSLSQTEDVARALLEAVAGWWGC